jgi:hypothetical protein
MPPRNADHSARVKIKIGPPGRFESRTATRPLGSRAVSTQLPLGLLWLLLRQSAAGACDGRMPLYTKSTVDPFALFLPFPCLSRRFFSVPPE